MDCSQTTWLSNKEYLKQFNKKVAQQRIPLSGSIDLTHRCNVRCVHCYLGDKTSTGKSVGKELSTAQWTNIIDDITDAGCLYLLITGGEPLLRNDFADIYSRAKTNGLLVTVFTNGTLITDRILDVFEDLPPYVVEITLYGATAPTYERITGVEGSYERCLRGIQTLLDHHVNVKLKTVLMTYNSHEFYDMENTAKTYGVKFRFDAAIFPCFNGDRTPIGLRVSPEEAVEKEFSDDDRAQRWKDLFERMTELPVSDKLYTCGSGATTFHIDPYGSLKPCLMVNSLKYDLLGGSFLTGWQDVMLGIREKEASAGFFCNQCEQRLFCGLCPGFFETENGAEEVCSEYLCAMGEHRLRALRNLTSTEV